MIELVPIVSTFDLKISYACCLVGQEIVAGDDLYGGSNHFLSEVVRKKRNYGDVSLLPLLSENMHYFQILCCWK